MLRKLIVALVGGGVFNAGCALPSMNTSLGERTSEAGAAGSHRDSSVPSNAGRNPSVGGGALGGGATNATSSIAGRGGSLGTGGNYGGASVGVGGGTGGVTVGVTLGGSTAQSVAGRGGVNSSTSAGTGNSGMAAGGSSGTSTAIAGGATMGGKTSTSGAPSGGIAGGLTGRSGGFAGALAGAPGAGGYAPITTAPADCPDDFGMVSVLAAQVKSNLGISKLTWQGVKGLTNLSVSCNSDNGEKAPSLNGIQCLTGLKKLTIFGCQLSDISALGVPKRLMNLTELDLSENQLSDLTPLAALENLTVLYVSHNFNPTTASNSLSISVVSSLPKLELLSAPACGIASIDGLQNHPALKSLDLYSNDLTTCKGLGTLPNLKILLLYQNGLTSAEGLSSLPVITELNLANQNSQSLTDISAIAGLTTLQTLDIGYNTALSNVDALTNLTALTELDAGACAIASVEPLKQLTNLVTLNLSNNELTSIAALSNLPKLATVDLTYNTALKDVSPLANSAAIAYPDYLYLTSTSVCQGTLSDLTNLAKKLNDGTTDGNKNGHLTLPCTL